MSQSETIKALYEAFGRGDVAAITAMVTDDVDWNNERVASKDCPWNGDFSGKAGLPGFFQAVGDNLDIHTFDPHTFVESGNHVVVKLRIESKLRKNGALLENDALHFWTFSGGKVSAYRHFNDTAAELLAWRS